MRLPSIFYQIQETLAPFLSDLRPAHTIQVVYHSPPETGGFVNTYS
jgi:hypothetical protein